MATIGTFTTNGNGFTGTIKTLNLNVKARIERVENPSDKGPQFRIFSGAVELGAAWKKVSDAGLTYYSVTLDDPSFTAPVYAALIPTEADPDRFNLAWSRPRSQDDDGY